MAQQQKMHLIDAMKWNAAPTVRVAVLSPRVQLKDGAGVARNSRCRIFVTVVIVRLCVSGVENK